MKIEQLEQNKKPNMDCINLLTSILICYPEISIISFEPEDEGVYLNYTINKILDKSEMQNFKDILMDSLLAYQHLERLSPKINEINLEVQENFTFIDIKRDVKTFSHAELRLIGELIKETFADFVISESERIPVVDPMIAAQSDLIDSMLGSIKINPVMERMIGIREDGRVIVYNK